MTRTKLVAVAFAALLVTVGTVAAAPGNAPVDVGADDQYDDHADAAADNADDASEDDDAAANESNDGQPADAAADNADGAAPDAAAESADRRGPPADLPAQVPDHVSAIHDLIRSFLGGDHDGSLGESVSDATPDDGGENAAPA
ncbi:hypothetical protein [Haloplanus natans]|uniref:hypothetical protein n=1 Tax=Haloplanus natans TaxID=376171 RepID=UPI00067767E3|nr:hypothetical protein [Haloplanus natans]